MGQFSRKGPPLAAVVLPCAECETKPCCRRGNGVDVHHAWREAAHVAGSPIPYTEAGNCPHLACGGCALQATKPAPCRKFDCREPLFRHLHPEVDALLRKHAL